MLCRPGQQIPDQLPILALGGNAGEAGFHHFSRVGLKVRRRVHATHEHAAIQAVAIVHHPAHPVAVLDHLAREARAHQPDKVGLNLKIDVIGVKVVFRVARPRGFDALIERAARPGVGMPETILRHAKRVAELLAGRLQVNIVHHLREGHLHVKVVLPDGVRHAVGRPLQLRLVNPSHRPELGRCSEGNPNHLASPASLDSVSQLIAGKMPGLGIGRKGTPGHAQRQYD